MKTTEADRAPYTPDAARVIELGIESKNGGLGGLKKFVLADGNPRGMSTVSQLLHDLELGSYEEKFNSECIELDTLLTLTEPDLQALGLPLGPRKRLLQRIQRLNAQTDTTVLRGVQIEERLGAGKFGRVFRGRWSGTDIALKTLAERDLLQEVALLQRLRHPNIVTYFGTYAVEDVTYIAMELCHFGSLSDFLRARFSSLQLGDLLAFACDTAAGMAYLHSYSIVHRDLAARNILISKAAERLTAKVADFGLSRQAEQGYYQLSVHSSLPVRWSSPEAIQTQRWTPSDDVWSFGVVLFEIFDYGGVPFPGHSNTEVIEAILNAELPERPDACPDNIHELMKGCFQSSELRPSFAVLHSRLQEMAHQPTAEVAHASVSAVFYYEAGVEAVISSRRHPQEGGPSLFASSSSDSDSLPELLGPTQGEILYTLLNSLFGKTDLDHSVFYEKLFELNPALEPLFAHVSTSHQGQKFFHMLLKLGEASRENKLETQQTILDFYELGRRHTRYQIQEDAILDMRDALLWTLAQPQFLGDTFTPAVQEIFIAGFRLAWGIMKQGIQKQRQEQQQEKAQATCQLQ